MKDDPARCDPAAYPFSLEMQVRYADMDTNAHLNNVAFARFFEEARVRMHHALGGKRALGLRPIIAHVGIDYLAEGNWPAPATVSASILRIGTSSYTVGMALFQAGKCIALCDSVVVNRTESGAGGAPLPDKVRQALATLSFAA